MLKRKLNGLAVVLLAAASLFFNSCKSLPESAPVDPLSLVDNDAGLYVYIPVQANTGFVNRTFSKVTGFSEKDTDQIVSRTQYIAIAAGTNNGATQIATSGNYPVKYLKYGINEKNGWVESDLNINENQYKVFSNYPKNLQLSVPSPYNAVVSADVNEMMKKYDFAEGLALNSDSKNADNVIPLGFDENIYNELTKIKNGEIKFYAAQPSQLVKLFLGKKVDVGIERASGYLLPVGTKESFGIYMDIELKDPKTMKASCAALKLAMFPVTAKIQQVSSKTIRITDLEVSWKQLTGLMDM